MEEKSSHAGILSPCRGAAICLHLSVPPWESYRGFLLDADNTLFDYDRAEREALQRDLRGGCPRGAARAGGGRLPRHQRPLLEALRSRVRSTPAGLQVRPLGGPVRRPGDRRATPPARLTATSTALSEKSHLLPGAAEVVREPRPGSARLCLVTNGLSRGAARQAGALGTRGLLLRRADLRGDRHGQARSPVLPGRGRRARAGSPPTLLCVGDSPAADVARSAGRGHRRVLVRPGGRAVARARGSAADVRRSATLRELLRSRSRRPVGVPGEAPISAILAAPPDTCDVKPHAS